MALSLLLFHIKQQTKYCDSKWFIRFIVKSSECHINMLRLPQYKIVYPWAVITTWVYKWLCNLVRESSQSTDHTYSLIHKMKTFSQQEVILISRHILPNVKLCFLLLKKRIKTLTFTQICQCSNLNPQFKRYLSRKTKLLQLDQIHFSSE